MLPFSNSEPSFLIIRLSSLGDILLTTPAIRCLRSMYPNATIDVLVKERYLELLEDNPNLSSLMALPDPADKKTVKNLIDQLRGNYKTVIDLHTGLRSAYIRRKLGAERVLTYDKKRFTRWLFITFRKNFYQGEFSVPLAYVKALAPLGVKDDGAGLDWPGALTKQAQFLELSGLNEAPFPQPVALCPGASFPTKRWPKEKWKELTVELLKKDRVVWIFGDESDHETGELLEKVNHERVVNFCGMLSLSQTGAGLSLCQFAVTHDAGPSHMAAAVGLPVIAIFGSTTPQFGFRPFRTLHRIAEIDLPCRPCSHLGYDECPERHLDCMQKQSVENILQLIEDLEKEIV